MKKIRPNQRELARLLKGPEMAEFLNEVGSKVAEAANETAPVGETGELSRSHYHEVEETKDRKVVRIKSNLDYAAKVASDTGYMTQALDRTNIE